MGRGAIRMPAHPTPLWITGDVTVPEWPAGPRREQHTRKRNARKDAKNPPMPAGHSGRAIDFLSRRVNGILPGTAGKERLTALPLTSPSPPKLRCASGGAKSRHAPEKVRGRGNLGSRRNNCRLSRSEMSTEGADGSSAILLWLNASSIGRGGVSCAALRRVVLPHRGRLHLRHRRGRPGPPVRRELRDRSRPVPTPRTSGFRPTRHVAVL